jgi:GDP-mannose 6-dehydrogenase
VKISVFGLGYVGCVSAACLAEDGHTVVGVDTQVAKVDLINGGQSPIVEPGLPELLSRARRDGRLAAVAVAGPAVCGTDLSMICVGTPSLPNGSIDVGSLVNVVSRRERISALP